MEFKLTGKRLALIVGAVALVASGTYSGYFHDQSIKGIYASLSPQIYGLQNTVNNQDSQISSLNSQIASLNARLSAEQQQNGQLQAPAMDGVFAFTGGSCGFFSGCSATVRGAWVNYGMQNARNVVVTLTWSKGGTFVQSNTINVGVVPGRSIALYPDTLYTPSSTVDHLNWSFSFSA
jgi:hypothetical protein